MIAKDLSLLTERLLATASYKEKLFYSFMTGKEVASATTGTTSSDRLCYESFVLDTQKSDVLESFQRTKPYKNIHYSTNLIDLVAAAKIDPKGEQDHVREYLSTHKLREAYLLHLALDMPINKDNLRTMEASRTVEKLIHSLVICKDLTEIGSLFFDAIAEAHDIFDAIVLRHLYQTFLKIHPDSHRLEHYESLHSISLALFTAFNRFIRIVLSFGVAACFYYFFGWLLENETLYNEIMKVSALVVVVVLAVLIILGINVPDKTKAIKWCTEKTIAVCYRLFGLNYYQINRELKPSLANNTHKKQATS